MWRAVEARWRVAVDGLALSKAGQAALHAWAHDAANLKRRLVSAAEMLRQCTSSLQTSCNGLLGLQGHLEASCCSCDVILDSCRNYQPPAWPKPVSTPCARPERYLSPSQRVNSTAASVKRGGGVPLVIGTFGWWEILCPTESAIHALCSSLAARKIQVCIVTGLPAASIQVALDGRFGYVWKGHMHADTRGVGLLVASPFISQVSLVHPLGVTDCRHIYCKLPGQLLVVGVYGPNPGTLPMEEHRQWLQDTVDVIQRTASNHGLIDVWLCGDLNLRGVAPGPAKCGQSGSATANLAAYGSAWACWMGSIGHTCYPCPRRSA